MQRRARLERLFPVWRPATLAQHFDVAAQRYPQRPLVLTSDRSYSYQEMMRWSRRIASGLIAVGVERRSQVALLLANLPEFVAVKLAIARIDATAVPINYLLRRTELQYVLSQSDSVALITMDSFRDIDYLNELDAIAPGWESQGGGAQLPKLRHVIVHPTGTGTARQSRTLQSLEALASPDSDAELVQREQSARAQDCCDIIYTSGTTGRSKGVMLTHDMILRTAYASAHTRAFEDARRIIFALPMYHVFGYIECLVAATFVGGAIIPQISFDAEKMLMAAESLCATDIICVPTMTLKLIETARERGFDSSHVVSFFNSGGMSPPHIWREIRELFAPEDIVTAYGMSETTASTVCTLPEDPEERLLASNGRPKLAGVAGDPSLGGALAVYKTVHPETGEDMPAGQPGEFVVRGPVVTQGYYNKPEETRAAFTDGWLKTGDIGIVAADGYLSLLGRIKESYRCGGEMVIPLEIEELVNEHPFVAQALVVGVPDVKMGEVGCLCIVPSHQGRPEPEELVALCASRLARFKIPKHVIFIGAHEVPMTATGRPQKFKLAELARARITDVAHPLLKT
jgi:fatty-acyl-CoA synthase